MAGPFPAEVQDFILTGPLLSHMKINSGWASTVNVEDHILAGPSLLTHKTRFTVSLQD